MKQTGWHLAGQCFYDHETQFRNLFDGRKWCVPGLWENFIKCLSRPHRGAANRSNPSCIFISSNTRHKDPRPPLITFPSEYLQNEISPPYTDLDIQRMVFSHDFHPPCKRLPSFDFLSLLGPARLRSGRCIWINQWQPRSNVNNSSRARTLRDTGSYL